MKAAGLNPALVVICFHFSIFEPLETTETDGYQMNTSCDLLSF